MISPKEFLSNLNVSGKVNQVNRHGYIHNSFLSSNSSSECAARKWFEPFPKF